MVAPVYVIRGRPGSKAESSGRTYPFLNQIQNQNQNLNQMQDQNLNQRIQNEN